MNPSDLSHYGNDPISYSDQAFSCTPFSIESNQTSKQGTDNCALPPPPPPPPLPSPPPLSFSQFPSPFEDNEIFHDFSVHHHQYLVAHEPPVNINIEVSINNKIIPMPRKRSCKRDRHSKINTARGLRDRRMRLSLEVAKRFFGLQDMLGFEKASKTVEWLLNQAKVEIKQLAREKNLNPSCASSTSECTEGISSLEEVVISGNQEQPHNKKVKRSKTKGSNSRKSAFDPLVARESREKARERARERTKEKIRSRKLLASDESKSNQCKEARITTNHNDNLNKLGSWNPFETVEESAGTHSPSMNPSLDVVTEAEERSSQAKENLGTVEDVGHDDDDSLGIMSKWSMIFNSLNNSVFLQEHQYAGFQSLGKPCWEPYNNHM